MTVSVDVTLNLFQGRTISNLSHKAAKPLFVIQSVAKDLFLPQRTQRYRRAKSTKFRKGLDLTLNNFQRTFSFFCSFS